MDELGLEETREYTMKMGRWRRKALDVTSTDFFWALLLVMNRTRAPLIHYSHFLKQKQSPDQDGKITCIVNGKCTQIMSEFWNLLFHKWSAYEYIDALSLSDASWLQCIAFQLICKNTSQFFRRIVLKTRQYPLKLFGLIKTSWDKPCETRRTIAKELLELRASGDTLQMDLSTRKLLGDKVFGQQIADASRTGQLGSELYTLLVLISRYTKVDVRENERINKLLSMLGESCPNANLAPGRAIR